MNNSIGFAVKCIPKGCLFADIGPVFQPRDEDEIYMWLGYLNSTIVKMITRLFQAGERGRFMWIANIVEQIPVPNTIASTKIAGLAKQASDLFREFECKDEVSPLFRGFLIIDNFRVSLKSISVLHNEYLDKCVT